MLQKLLLKMRSTRIETGMHVESSSIWLVVVHLLEVTSDMNYLSQQHNFQRKKEVAHIKNLKMVSTSLLIPLKLFVIRSMQQTTGRHCNRDGKHFEIFQVKSGGRIKWIFWESDGRKYWNVKVLLNVQRERADRAELRHQFKHARYLLEFVWFSKSAAGGVG